MMYLTLPTHISLLLMVGLGFISSNAGSTELLDKKFGQEKIRCRSLGQFVDNENEGSGAWCGRSFCGCSFGIALECETEIVSDDMIPLPGIKVSCRDKLLAVSNSQGKVAFTWNSRWSPGCGFECNVLTFEKEGPSAYEAWEVKVDYFSDTTRLKQQHKKGERTKGVFDGKWEEWCWTYPEGRSGAMKVLGHYQDGLKNGEWTEWHCSTGAIKSRRHYREGKIHGVSEEWYENGQISHLSEWHDDRRHGKTLSWHPDGEVETEQAFREGKPVGESKYTPRKMDDDFGGLDTIPESE